MEFDVHDASIFPLAPCDHVDDFPIKRATRNLPNLGKQVSVGYQSIDRFPDDFQPCVLKQRLKRRIALLYEASGIQDQNPERTILDQSVKIGGSLCHALFQPVTRLL